jgi:hypothetical protein
VSLWTSSARDMRRLVSRPPAKTVAVQIAPGRRGMRGRVVIVF